MTRDEFLTKFDSIHSEQLNSYAGNVKENLSKYADENNKISSEKIAIMSVMESINFNTSLLKNVLLSVLEFDD